MPIFYWIPSDCIVCENGSERAALRKQNRRRAHCRHDRLRQPLQPKPLDHVAEKDLNYQLNKACKARTIDDREAEMTVDRGNHGSTNHCNGKLRVFRTQICVDDFRTTS